MENIDTRIRTLSSVNRKKFEETFVRILYDSMWFSLRGLNPRNIAMAKIVLYNEMFEDQFSHLNRDYLN